MESLIKHLKQLKELYMLFVFFIGTVIGGYEVYTNITTDINNLRVATESTNITMLKGVVRSFEKQHECEVSDPEWEEYLLNYSTLFDLKVKHGMLSEKAQWMPIERNEDVCK